MDSWKIDLVRITESKKIETIEIRKKLLIQKAQDEEKNKRIQKIIRDSEIQENLNTLRYRRWLRDHVITPSRLTGTKDTWGISEGEFIYSKDEMDLEDESGYSNFYYTLGYSWVDDERDAGLYCDEDSDIETVDLDDIGLTIQIDEEFDQSYFNKVIKKSKRTLGF